MVISKMNSAMHKHGKWAFGILTIALVVSLGYGLGGNSCRRGSSKVGTALDKEFSNSDINKIGRYVNIISSLQAGFVTRSYGRRENNIQLLVRARAADKLGIFASDKELKAAISELPSFQKKDGLDVAKFDKFLNEDLKKADISGEDIDEALRFMIKIRKVTGLFVMNTPMQASDAQLKLLYRYLYEKLTSTSYTFDIANYKKDVKVDEKSIGNFFAKNKDKYLKPKTVSFDYAIISYQKYANDANGKITKEDLKKYYDNNKELFIKDPTATKEKAEYKTFASVKGEVRKRLIKENSRNIANMAATTFVTELFQNTDMTPKKRLKIFGKMAKKDNLEVLSERIIRSDAVGYKGPAPKVLFDMIEETDIDTTYAVKAVEGSGDNEGNFFVAIVDAKEPASIVEKITDLPKDIQKQMKNDYIMSESLRLARADAQKVYNLVTENKPFVKKDSKVVIEKNGIFTLQSASLSVNKNIGDILELTLPTSAGKYSKLKESASFGALFVKVEKRESPDMAKFAKLKPMIMMMHNSMSGSRNGLNQRLSPGEILLGSWLNENSSLYKRK